MTSWGGNEEETRSDLLKLCLYELNVTISPKEARIASVMSLIHEIDHTDPLKHDQELDLQADKILFQKLAFARLIHSHSHSHSYMQSDNHTHRHGNNVSHDNTYNLFDEVGYLVSALEMVYRASRSRVALSFNEIGHSILPLFVDMIQPHSHSHFHSNPNAPDYQHDSNSGNKAKPTTTSTKAAATTTEMSVSTTSQDSTRHHTNYNHHDIHSAATGATTVTSTSTTNDTPIHPTDTQSTITTNDAVSVTSTANTESEPEPPNNTAAAATSSNKDLNHHHNYKHNHNDNYKYSVTPTPLPNLSTMSLESNFKFYSFNILATLKVLKILRYFSRVLNAMVPMANHPGLLDALLYQIQQTQIASLSFRTNATTQIDTTKQPQSSNTNTGTTTHENQNHTPTKSSPTTPPAVLAVDRVPGSNILISTNNHKQTIHHDDHNDHDEQDNESQLDDDLYFLHQHMDIPDDNRYHHDDNDDNSYHDAQSTSSSSLVSSQQRRQQRQLMHTKRRTPHKQKLIQHSLSKCRIDAIAIIVNLACSEENKFKLLHHPKLLDVVISMARDDYLSEAREHASIVLMNLVLDERNKVQMAQNNEFLSVLAKLLSDSSEYTRRYASAAIFTLASSPQNTKFILQFSSSQAVVKDCNTHNNTKVRNDGDHEDTTNKDSKNKEPNIQNSNVINNHHFDENDNGNDCDGDGGDMLTALSKSLLNDSVEEVRLNIAEALFHLCRNGSVDDLINSIGNHDLVISSLGDAVLMDYSADVRAYCARALEWLAADIHHPAASHKKLISALKTAAAWTKTTCIVEALKAQSSFEENRKAIIEEEGMLDALANLACLEGLSNVEVRDVALETIERLTFLESTRELMASHEGIMTSLTMATFNNKNSSVGILEDFDEEGKRSKELTKSALKNLAEAL